MIPLCSDIKASHYVGMGLCFCAGVKACSDVAQFFAFTLVVMIYAR